MANKFIGETSGKYWKQKNDETYVNEDELVKITDLDESDSVEDDDLLIKGNSSTGKMLRIKVANFLDGIKGKLLGNKDISSVGDGTVTGAISENAKNISANKDDADSKYNELNSALAAKMNKYSNETISPTTNTTGWLTTSNTDIVFSIPISNRMGTISSITCSTYTIRQNGSYLKNNETFTGTLTYAQNVIETRITLSHSSSLGGTNNDVVGIYAQLSITFS